MSTTDTIRIVVLGDSITKADQVTPECRFTTLLEKQLPAPLGRPVKVINSGVNADIAPLALGRLQRDVLDHGCDCAVIMFGVNDAGFFRPKTPETPAATPRVTPEEFSSALRQMAARMSAAGCGVVFATPVPMSRHYWLADLPQYVENGLNYIVDRYAQIVRDVAGELGCPLIDVHRVFTARPETGDYVPDGIHPDARGQRLIADVYLESLVQCL